MSRRTGKKVTAILAGGLIAICIIFIICAGVSINRLKTENKKLKNQVESLETKMNTPVEKEKLVLKCGTDVMIFDETNGIKTVGTKNFEVETTYPIVLYQVVGEDGKILQNSYDQYKGTAKEHFFKLEDTTEELTEIRLTAWNNEGEQLESRVYKFVFLDKIELITKDADKNTKNKNIDEEHN